jgi:hypothetical protein
LGIIWRKSLLAIWRKAWACRSWRSCRQRLGILRYHASGCLNHTLSSIERRGRRGSSLSDGALCLAVTPNSEHNDREKVGELRIAIANLSLPVCNRFRFSALALSRIGPTDQVHLPASARFCPSNGRAVPGYGIVYDLVREVPSGLLTLAHQGSMAYSEGYDLVHRREAARSSHLAGR